MFLVFYMLMWFKPVGELALWFKPIYTIIGEKRSAPAEQTRRSRCLTKEALRPRFDIRASPLHTPKQTCIKIYRVRMIFPSHRTL